MTRSAIDVALLLGTVVLVALLLCVVVTMVAEARRAGRTPERRREDGE